MITQYPQWVDPNSFPNNNRKNVASSTLQDVYSPHGEIPFPKDTDPLFTLDELLNTLLIKPLAEHELTAINQLSKKIKKTKKSIISSSGPLIKNEFDSTLFSNSFSKEGYFVPKEESVFEAHFGYLNDGSGRNPFQLLVSDMDTIYPPAHYLIIKGVYLVPVSEFDDIELSTSDIKKFCKEVGIDSTLIDNIAIDYSSENPGLCRLSIEKRIPF